MHPLIQKLKKAMLEEREIYQDLLHKAEEKQTALVENNTQAINEILEYETTVIGTLKGSNKETQSILEDIQQEFQLEQLPSLTDLINIVETEADKQQLRELQDDFREIVQELSDRNQLNQRLIETQLQYTAFNLEILTQGQALGDTYSQSGEIKESNTERVGLIDHKA
ncbi:flagellar protein FlgN [Clostridia bacterium OttesenSCG-928-F22]|nr:flagellar protein FlgN [Clostridia bacterium OttesenSCG-928-F22]